MNQSFTAQNKNFLTLNLYALPTIHGLTHLIRTENQNYVFYCRFIACTNKINIFFGTQNLFKCNYPQEICMRYSYCILIEGELMLQWKRVQDTQLNMAH